MATFATHSLDDGAQRVLGDVQPNGVDTHVFAEYVSEQAFQETGWQGAQHSGEGDMGEGAYSNEGFPTLLFGLDLPALAPGTEYRYRLVAINASGEATGEERTLTVPAASGGTVAPCANASLRFGLSAGLPDCRAYELVTPAEKGSAMDTDTYGNVVSERWVAEDGERMGLRAPGTQWGSSPDSKVSTYLFTRASNGWQMSSATPQPRAGAFMYSPEIFSPDLRQVDLEVSWLTSPVVNSPNVELVTGPPGGPYTVIVSAPYLSGTRWAGASADDSKLIVSTEDHALVGKSTGTLSGADLYEYTQEGGLRQINVTSAGTKLGTCGASLVRGREGAQEREIQADPNSSSPHAVSADGSRVSFEPFPAAIAMHSGISTYVRTVRKRSILAKTRSMRRMRTAKRL